MSAFSVDLVMPDITGALTGFGAAAIATGGTTISSRVYSDGTRARAFALLSSLLLSEGSGIPLAEPPVSEHDRDLLGASASPGGALSRFGRSFVGEPDVIADELLKDQAVGSADTLLVATPNLPGVSENLRRARQHRRARRTEPRLGGNR